MQLRKSSLLALWIAWKVFTRPVPNEQLLTTDSTTSSAGKWLFQSSVTAQSDLLFCLQKCTLYARHRSVLFSCL